MKLSKERIEGINLIDLASSVYVSGLRLRETALELYADLEKAEVELAGLKKIIASELVCPVCGEVYDSRPGRPKEGEIR